MSFSVKSRTLRGANNNGGGGGGTGTKCGRWNPTVEQLKILTDLFRAGLRTPTTDQIQKISTELSFYGKIESKNVFYWFQNHKARERQKRRKISIDFDHHHHHHQPPSTRGIISRFFFLKIYIIWLFYRLYLMENDMIYSCRSF